MAGCALNVLRTSYGLSLLSRRSAMPSTSPIETDDSLVYRKPPPSHTFGAVPHELVRESTPAAKLKSIFEDRPVEAYDLLYAHCHMVCRHVGLLKPDLSRQQIVHSFSQDHRMGVEFLLARTDADHAAVLLKQLLHQDVGGQEGLLRGRTSLDDLLHLLGQPGVEPRPKHRYAQVRRFVKMVGL